MCRKLAPTLSSKMQIAVGTCFRMCPKPSHIGLLASSLVAPHFQTTLVKGDGALPPILSSQLGAGLSFGGLELDAEKDTGHKKKLQKTTK